MNESANWDMIVKKSILHHKDFKGAEVNNLESLHSIVFSLENYPAIVLLIKENKTDTIKSFNISATFDFREYLDIVQFSDENNNTYLVTVYDNDALEQDPEVLDIFILSQ